MHTTLGGCFGAVVGFVVGVLAGLVLAEGIFKPGLDRILPMFAISGMGGLVFAALGYKAGKWGAGRKNPTDES